jgi:REP element-mobilizing transposase RayT
LQGYDYTQAGAYFVTICTHERYHWFGEVVDSVMHLNAMGQIAAAYWANIPDHFPHVELDGFVVMPNHVHGILVMVPSQKSSQRSNTPDVGTRHASSADIQTAHRQVANASSTDIQTAQTQVTDVSSAETGLSNTRTRRASCLQSGGKPSNRQHPRARGAASGSLGAIIGAYKAAVAKEINHQFPHEVTRLWQERYHDHIIRDEASLNMIRQYVAANPARWCEDVFFGAGRS